MQVGNCLFPSVFVLCFFFILLCLNSIVKSAYLHAIILA